MNAQFETPAAAAKTRALPVKRRSECHQWGPILPIPSHRHRFALPDCHACYRKPLAHRSAESAP